MALCKRIQLRRLFYNPLISNAILQKSSFSDVICKVLDRKPSIQPFLRNGYAKKSDLGGFSGGGSVRYLCSPVKGGKRECKEKSGSGKGSKEVKQKRKKPKGKRECEEKAGSDNGSKELNQTRKKPKKMGKRAVVKWLKNMRYKKKKEFESMTPEEKILFKMTKARRKEKRLLGALAKLKPKLESETYHDPEILTPEEQYYFLRMGEKCKNYVPVGRRGIFQGVILNMHLHWKKHQTLQVTVSSFPREEVRDIAVDLARLSGGIVLDIQEKNTIIMYRGKNYSQPPTEIMSPLCTLPKIKALKKSKYIDALRSVRSYIPWLEQRLDLLRAQAEVASSVPKDKPTDADNDDLGCASKIQYKKGVNRLKQLIAKTEELIGKTEVDHEIEDSKSVSVTVSDSEDLSDMFETESDRENDDDDDKEEQHLYLDEFEKFPVSNNEETEDLEDHQRQISAAADAIKEKSQAKSDGLADLDEVDRMVIQAASSLKKKWR